MAKGKKGKAKVKAVMVTDSELLAMLDAVHSGTDARGERAQGAIGELKARLIGKEGEAALAIVAETVKADGFDADAVRAALRPAPDLADLAQRFRDPAARAAAKGRHALGIGDRDDDLAGALSLADWRMLARPATPPLPDLASIALSGSGWAATPDPRQWLIDDWLPAGELSILYGPGGAGKSTLALQWAFALAHGPTHRTHRREWLPDNPRGDPVGVRDEQGRVAERERVPTVTGAPCRVVVAGWEDSANHALHVRGRLARDKTLGAKCEAAQGHVAYLAMRGRGPAHGPAETGSRHISTVPELTSTGAELRAYCEGEGARLLILDPLSLAISTDETNRALVSEVLGDWSGWSERTGIAVLICSHPNKAGDLAGSQAFQGLARSILQLASPNVTHFGAELDKLRGAQGTRDRIAVLMRDKASYAAGVDDDGQAAERMARDGLWMRLSRDGGWVQAERLAVVVKASGKGKGNGTGTARAVRADADGSNLPRV